MKGLVALLLAPALALSACTAASPSPSPSSTATRTASATPIATIPPTASPTATPLAKLTPLQAADVLRKNVTGARPLLIVNGIPDDWTAEVTLASASAFNVTYRDPGATKALIFMLAAANPPLPGAATTQAHPSFHGDGHSLYQVSDGSDPKSDRFLLWVEAGTWTEPGPGGIPYYLVGTGLTDAEFWLLANSLHPNQI